MQIIADTKRLEVVKTIENGYIKLHRKMVNWEWFSDPNTSHLFVYLLLSASWQDSKWRGIDIPRGSLITSLSHLAENTGLSIQSVRTSLNKLKSTNELTYKSTNKFTLVTIVKYSDYQDTDFTNQQANQQANQQTTNKQLTTSKEYKEYKNINNNIPPLSPQGETSVKNNILIPEGMTLLPVKPPDSLNTPEFIEAWKEWETYRKQKRQKLTPMSIKKQYSFLASHSVDIAIKIIEQSISNGWTGLFELKNNNYQKKNGKRLDFDTLDLDRNPFEL